VKLFGSQAQIFHILCELFLVHIHHARAFKNNKNTFNLRMTHFLAQLSSCTVIIVAALFDLLG
jgi:hypothetical protein